jgi:hypothetical protein
LIPRLEKRSLEPAATKEGSSSTEMPPEKRLFENEEYHRFTCVVFQFQPLLERANQQRFLDTIDFSRVEVQFQPNFASSKKAETETPHD